MITQTEILKQKGSFLDVLMKIPENIALFAPPSPPPPLGHFLHPCVIDKAKIR